MDLRGCIQDAKICKRKIMQVKVIPRSVTTWAAKARNLMYSTCGMYNSAKAAANFGPLCTTVRTPDDPPLLCGLKIFLSYKFHHFKLFNVLKITMFLWIRWIMERCYLHLWWYFFVCPHLPQAHHVHIPAQGLWGSQADPWVEFVTISSRICHNLQ